MRGRQICPYGYAFLVNQGDDSFIPAVCANGFPGLKAGGMDVCDINADGLADIVYSGECDRGDHNWAATGVLMNQGDGSFVNFDYDFLQLRGGAACRAADYKRNGRPSIALMGYGDGGFGLYDQAAPEAPEAGLFTDYLVDSDVRSLLDADLKVQAEDLTR